MAYAEAIKRRKGAVREIKKETTKYAGEASGIKVGLKKSVRTKYWKYTTNQNYSCVFSKTRLESSSGKFRAFNTRYLLNNGQ